MSVLRCVKVTLGKAAGGPRSGGCCRLHSAGPGKWLEVDRFRIRMVGLGDYWKVVLHSLNIRL